MRISHLSLASVPLLAAVAALTGCPPPADVGGPVDGAADTHCQGVTPVLTDPAVCDGVGEGEGEGDAGDDDYGATMFNTEGDDDDCKYHVKYSVSDVTEGADVTFTVTATKLADNDAPAAGANARAEVFLDDNHPAPNAGTATTEGDAGVYTITPVRFDAPGRWTVRFHFYENCVDSETSQHGHAAFFIDVP